MLIDNINSRLLALKEIEGLLNGDGHNSINNGDSFYKSILGISIRRLGEINFHLQKYIKKPLKQNQNIIKALEDEQLKTDVPAFGPGDTVVVQVKVKEGAKERLQAFEGVVIAKRNRGLHSAFTVRKISNGEGVERVFQTHSPLIDSVAVKRRGAVRRAKLYYLRERSGKSARIREKLN